MKYLIFIINNIFFNGFVQVETLDGQIIYYTESKDSLVFELDRVVSEMYLINKKERYFCTATKLEGDKYTLSCFNLMEDVSIKEKRKKKNNLKTSYSQFELKQAIDSLVDKVYFKVFNQSSQNKNLLLYQLHQDSIFNSVNLFIKPGWNYISYSTIPFKYDTDFSYFYMKCKDCKEIEFEIKFEKTKKSSLRKFPLQYLKNDYDEWITMEDKSAEVKMYFIFHFYSDKYGFIQ